MAFYVCYEQPPPLPFPIPCHSKTRIKLPIELFLYLHCNGIWRANTHLLLLQKANPFQFQFQAAPFICIEQHNRIGTRDETQRRREDASLLWLIGSLVALLLCRRLLTHQGGLHCGTEGQRDSGTELRWCFSRLSSHSHWHFNMGCGLMNG